MLRVTDNVLRGSVGTATVLILAGALSSLGDVMFAFFWNASLLLSNPTLGLTLLGIVGTAGLVIGTAASPRASQIDRQALFLAVGSMVRVMAILGVAVTSFVAPQFLIASAIAVQFLDILVTIITAGTITMLISQVVSKDSFTRYIGLNRTAARTAVISGWVVGGILLQFAGMVGLLLGNVLCFVPIALVFFKWRHRNDLKLIRVKDTLDKTIDNHPPARIIRLIAPFSGVIIVGSFVSRTPPLLWEALFPNDNPSVSLLFGLLFGLFTVAFLAAGLLVAIPRAAKIIDENQHGFLLVAASTIALGISILALPLVKSPLFFLADTAITGFVGG